MKNRFIKRMLLVCMGLFLGIALAELTLRVHTAMTARRVPLKRYVDTPPAAPGTIRMALLGGSTADGTPYSDVMNGSKFNLLSITSFLLEKRYGRPVEVDNYSGPNWSAETTVNHYFERPGLKPDVLVLYAGQNETTRYYSPNMVPPPAFLSPLAKLQFGNLLLRRLFTSQVAPADQRYTGQFFSDNFIPAYEREYNLARYRRYVERMIRHAECEGILLIIVIPQSNYLFPPTRSVYCGPEGRKAEALQLFKQAWRARYVDNEPERARLLLEQLSGFCSFADMFYELGKLHYARSEFDTALSYLRRARDNDGFPTCITEAYRDVLQELVAEYSVPHVDMDEVIREQPDCPVPDYASFLDDCHLGSEVYLALSRGLIRAMRENGFAALAYPPKDLAITDAEWTEHFGMTSLVYISVLAWQADYHGRQADYMFRKRGALRKAWSYLQRIKDKREGAGDPDLAVALDKLASALQAEDLRMQKWISHDGPMPVGDSGGDAPSSDFGEDIEIETSQGNALLLHGEPELALHHYRAALAISPDSIKARVNVGVALYDLHQFEAAAREFRRVLLIKPQELSALRNLGKALLKLKRFDEAVTHYREAVRMAPENEDILRDYYVVVSGHAWQLATDPELLVRDGDRAVILAEEVCRITGYESFDALDTLAAAYAEKGRFADAVTTADKALALARQHGNPRATAIAERLAEYKAGRPWRDGGEK